MANSFAIVEEFERRVAEFAGAPYAVAVDCCTNALFLCCKYLQVKEVTIPAKTYISVPMSIKHAGGTVKFEDVSWSGVYKLKPYPIFDGAKRFQRGMYKGGFHCLSFHAKKHLNIGKGGMILCSDWDAVKWLRKARYDGRSAKPYAEEKVDMMGYHFYMQPDTAARGLFLLDLIADNLPDLTEDYPDLRQMPVFQEMHIPV